MVAAGKAISVVTVVAEAVLLTSQSNGNGNTEYSPSSGRDDDEKENGMKLDYVTDYWLEVASEGALRSVEDEMREELDTLDYDSDEYLQLDLKRIDVVNAIASIFPLNLPHREHGWYLPNGD